MSNITPILSTGTVVNRRNGRNHKLVIDCSRKIGSRKFEFLMMESWYDIIDGIIDDLLTAELEFPVFHMDKWVGNRISRNSGDDIKTAVSLFELNCRLANMLGSEKLVLHLWGNEHSDHHFDVNKAVLGELIPIAEGHNLILTVENVVCAEKSPLERILELHENYPSVKFTYDVKMSAFHNESICNDRFSELIPSIGHLHVSDYDGGYKQWAALRCMPLGMGHIDFKSQLDYLIKSGYAGYMTLESTCVNEDGSTDFDSLNSCIDIMNRLTR